MTISSATNRSGPYQGNGSTTEFDFEFQVSDASHLRVILAEGSNETVLTLDTDYSVTGVGQSEGGFVTLMEPPTLDQTITILLNVPFTQETDLENQGAYYAETIEQALDLAAQRDLQLKEEVDRSVKLPASADLEDLEALIGDVIRIADSADNIDTVAGSIANVNTVAGSIEDVNALGPIAPAIATVSSIKSDVEDVADLSASITIVAGIKEDVQTVALIAGSIVVVADIAAKIEAVEAIEGNIITVAGIAANVTTVAGIASNVTAVAGIKDDIAAVEDIKTDVTAVAGMAGDVSAIAGMSADLATIVGLATDIETVVANIEDIQDAEENAAAAQDALADFLNRYLGAFSNAPTQTPNGDPLEAGMLYYHTGSSPGMRVRNAANNAWEEAFVPAEGYATTGYVDSAVSIVAGDVANLEDDVGNLEDDVNDLESDVSDLQGAVLNLQSGKEDADADIMKKDEDQTGITAGFASATKDDGTPTSTYKPTPIGGNYRKIICDGALVIQAPDAAGDYTMIIKITNGSSAGTKSFSGFTKEPSTDDFTDDEGDVFLVHIRKVDGTVMATVEACQ